MGDIVLADRDRFGVAWRVDTESGTVLGGPVTGIAHGLVHLRGHEAASTDWRLAAVYSSGGRLLLQVDDRRWDLENVEVTHDRSADGMFCTFTVSDREGIQFELVYVSLRLDPLNQADPSFDDLDEECQDFFLWIGRDAPSSQWRADVLAGWGTGFEVERVDGPMVVGDVAEPS